MPFCQAPHCQGGHRHGDTGTCISIRRELLVALISAAWAAEAAQVNDICYSHLAEADALLN